jgi:SulP family sulfate permease
MIAVLQAKAAGLWTRSHIRNNMLAGIVVGVMTSLFGGTRVQISGPTGAFIAVLAVITAQHGINGLQIATLMAGLILFGFGFARLGAVIKYIPNPVIVGFTAGIAVIIFVGQWKDFFGLTPAPSGAHFHEKFLALVEALPSIHVATTGLAVLALLILTVGARYLRRIPAPLIALLVVTVVQYVCHFNGVATIGTAYGGIPRTLPSLSFPHVTLAQVVSLVGPAFTIALLGAIESLLSAVVADGMTGFHHDSNQELIGQGLANMVAPLFGGFAATGAIARTATNIRNGADSPLAGLVHSGFLILVILLLAPLAAAIPLCCLSAVLFVVAWNMSELPHVMQLVRSAPKTDVVVLVLTFLLTVFVDLVVAVNVGVIVAALLFMRRMAASGTPGGAGGTASLAPGVLVYSIEGPLFFGAAEKLERTLAHIQRPATTLILRMGNVPFLDATGIIAIGNMVTDFKRHGAVVFLVELKPNVRYKLERGGVIANVGEANVIDSLAGALLLTAKRSAPIPPLDPVLP